MTPKELQQQLKRIAQARLQLSIMIWGPPGIGKSSIVQQVGEELKLPVIDLRLSQLAPTDLRGLPVARDGHSEWYPPEFLPREGEGILFLDEFNMAVPAMQGIAQQLILDRKVGNYVLPEGWLIWAAGNPKGQRVSTHEMPAPLANRFVHWAVEADLESFRTHALDQGLPEELLAFLAFRPRLLHQFDSKQNAWPSPRAWVMASQLWQLGLDPAGAVGEGAAGEFKSFLKVYRLLPDLERILEGQAIEKGFPSDPGARFAICTGLACRVSSVEQALRAMNWLVREAPAEWVQLFVSDLFPTLRRKQLFEAVSQALIREDEFRRFIGQYRKLLEAA